MWQNDEQGTVNECDKNVCMPVALTEAVNIARVKQHRAWSKF